MKLSDKELLDSIWAKLTLLEHQVENLEDEFYKGTIGDQIGNRLDVIADDIFNLRYYISTYAQYEYYLDDDNDSGSF